MKNSIKLLAVSLLLLPTYLLSQECEAYFPGQTGTELVVKNYDNKDKLTGTTKQKLVEKKELEGKVEYVVDSKVYDADAAMLYNNQLSFICEGGKFYLDMNGLLPGTDAYKDMDVEVSGSDLLIPNNLSVGQELPDANVSMKVKSNGMTIISMNVTISNRKVEAKEDITVPAGTFSCNKITYTMETKMMMNIKATVSDWMAKDIGLVRQESFDKNGKLSAYSVLSEINK